MPLTPRAAVDASSAHAPSDPSFQKTVSGFVEEFGIKWSQLLIIVPAIISYFGLEQYINGGVWIGGIVMSFAIVYPFRRWVSDNFLGTAVCCVVIFAGGCTGLTYLFLKIAGSSVASFEQLNSFAQAHSKLDTIYLSIAVGIPLAIGIVSYRKQDDFVRSPLPRPVRCAVQESVVRADFVFDKAKYKVALRPLASGDVRVLFTAELQVRNRRKEPLKYDAQFDPAGWNKRFTEASIDGRPVDPTKPENVTGRGLLLSCEIPAGKTATLVVSFESTYNGRDSEFIGVYRPTAEYSLTIEKIPKSLKFNEQQFVHRKRDTQKLKNGDLLFLYKDGMLPFQGLRLFWEVLHDVDEKAAV